MYNMHSFKIRLGPTSWLGIQPTRDWNQAELKKKQGKKKPGVIQWVDLARLSQKPGCNMLNFVF
jgi:hypothetical protein